MSPRVSMGIVLAALQATRQKIHIIGRANFPRIVEPFFPQLYLSCLWPIIPDLYSMRRGCAGQLCVRPLPARHAENAFLLHSILKSQGQYLCQPKRGLKSDTKCRGLTWLRIEPSLM